MSVPDPAIPAPDTEPLEWINRFARLPEAFYDRPPPAPFPGASCLASSPNMLERLGLDADTLARDPWLGACTRGSELPGAEPLASVYAGHQFGVFVPQLGDGRAKLLGEVRTPAGETWELQVKGAGATRYSRGADGRAVLRSSVREYLVSEAMAALGIPTTRAVALFGSSLRVYRERIEPGAIVLRAAPSFLRFGHFEYFHYAGYSARLRELIDYALAHDYPELADTPDPVAALLEAVIGRTAEMIADWQAVGFCHGVMNTDNMSLLGLTIDYGPFAFMDAFDPGYICNHTDQAGRYAFNQQPQIAQWNLIRLAETLVIHFADPTREAAIERAKDLLQDFESRYQRAWLVRMRAKLGLQQARAEDDDLVNELLRRMAAEGVDFTRFFRQLPELEQGAIRGQLESELEDLPAWQAWWSRYQERLAVEGRAFGERRAAMNAVNPKYILRNHLAQTAIEQAETGDPTEVRRLQQILAHPFDEQPEFEAYADLPPDWACGIQLSCSS